MKSGKLRKAYQVIVLMLAAAAAACSSEKTSNPTAAVIGTIEEGVCVLDESSDAGTSTATAPKYLSELGCSNDYNALASVPMDTSLTGARSTKVVLDTVNDNTLYFQNSQLYSVHFEFVKANLKNAGDSNTFETTQYYAPESDRRFLLGAVTHYEGPNIWALEIAAYDTMTPAMIKKLFDAIKDKAFFGPGLRFHPTSLSLEATAKKLDGSVPVVTTSDLYGSITYQPLVLASAKGQLLFFGGNSIRNFHSLQRHRRSRRSSQ